MVRESIAPKDLRRDHVSFAELGRIKGFAGRPDEADDLMAAENYLVDDLISAPMLSRLSCWNSI